MTPLSKVKSRRIASRQAARLSLEALVAGNADAFESYRLLYGLWCSNNSALQELRPLFSIKGVEPNGCFSVTEEFRKEVLSLAKRILPQFHTEPSDVNG